VERAVYLHDDPARPIDTLVLDPFASPFRPKAATSATTSAAQPIDLKKTLVETEVRLLTEALDVHRHNQKLAAKHLGLGYHQFRNRLRKYGLA